MRFLPSGDTGLTVQLGDTIDRATNQRVRALAQAIERAAIGGVRETVPAYVSLLVHYDPLVIGQGELIDALTTLEVEFGRADTPPRRLELPVCFEGDQYAPDLGHVADWAGITPAEVVDDVVGSELFVYMIGFAPGQPYLGDLPERIALPRRIDPVPKVPKGSVLVATGKMVIYPFDNPTGWHVIGRTPFDLFDIRQDQPTLLRPGDQVTLKPIDGAAFEAMRAAITRGEKLPVEVPSP